MMWHVGNLVKLRSSSHRESIMPCSPLELYRRITGHYTFSKFTAYFLTFRDFRRRVIQLHHLRVHLWQLPQPTTQKTCHLCQEVFQNRQQHWKILTTSKLSTLVLCRGLHLLKATRYLSIKVCTRSMMHHSSFVLSHFKSTIIPFLMERGM